MPGYPQPRITVHSHLDACDILVFDFVAAIHLGCLISCGCSHDLIVAIQVLQIFIDVDDDMDNFIDRDEFFSAAQTASLRSIEHGIGMTYLWLPGNDSISIVSGKI